MVKSPRGGGGGGEGGYRLAHGLLSFRFKSMSEENGQLIGGTKAELVRCTLSYFIFPQRGAVLLDWLQKGEKRKTEERTRT